MRMWPQTRSIPRRRRRKPFSLVVVAHVAPQRLGYQRYRVLQPLINKPEAARAWLIHHHQQKAISVQEPQKKQK